MIDLGISEGLRKIGLVNPARVIERPHLLRTLAGVNTAQGSTGDNTQSAGLSFAELSKQSNAKTGYTGAATPGNTLKDMATSINTKNTGAKSSAMDSIGKGWDDSDSSISSASKALKQMNGAIGYIGNAGESLRDAYQRNLDKKKEAVAGNRELITKNQTSTLRDQADELRNSIFNNNLIMGGGASSASGAAARLLSKAMGKNRQAVLTQSGDQISEQNQQEQDAVETHDTMREASYEWEKRQRAEMITKYNDSKAALDRLKKKVPEWKQADIDKESDSNLRNLLSGIGEISSAAKSYRDYINQIITGKNDEATAAEMEAIGINAPAALDTPEFSDNIEMPIDGSQVQDDATSYYNPAVTGKKRIGTDIFGNPLTYDEAMQQQ